MQILIIEQHFLIMKRGPGVVVLKKNQGKVKKQLKKYANENCFKIKDLENIQKIVSKDCFILRPFETFERKMIKLNKKFKKGRPQKIS